MLLWSQPFISNSTVMSLKLEKRSKGILFNKTLLRIGIEKKLRIILGERKNRKRRGKVNRKYRGKGEKKQHRRHSQGQKKKEHKITNQLTPQAQGENNENLRNLKEEKIKNSKMIEKMDVTEERKRILQC